MDAGVSRVEFEAHGQIASTVGNDDKDIYPSWQNDLISCRNGPNRSVSWNRAASQTQVRQAASGEAYTWWSNRGQAWAKNVGWRIDYQIASPGLAAAARHVAVFKDQRFSDHAPLTIDYDLACV